MNYHLTIITTDIGVFSETLANYSPKLLVHQDNPETLVEIMLFMIQSLSSHPSTQVHPSISSHGSRVNDIYVNTIKQLTFDCL